MKADKCTTCEGDGFYRRHRHDHFTDDIIKNKPCYSCHGSGFDTKDDYYVACPHCGYKHDHTDIEIYESREGLDCYKCEKEFDVNVEITLNFSTFKIQGK